jgi:hypothetical protein
MKIGRWKLLALTLCVAIVGASVWLRVQFWFQNVAGLARVQVIPMNRFA